MSPAEGVSKPAIIRISVVLPQPDGPRIEKNDPRGTPKLTSSTAVKGPNRLLTPLALEIVAHPAPGGRRGRYCAAWIRSRVLPSMSSIPGGMLAKYLRLSRSACVKAAVTTVRQLGRQQLEPALRPR